MMKRFGLAMVGGVAAVPALAHEGAAHLHPHGSGNWILLVVAAALVVAALVIRGRS